MNAKTHTARIAASIARRALRLALTIACLCLPLTGYSATYLVGTCRPDKPAFQTIQQAVSAVPAGSIIDVCPGNYSEWVYITQPLTLQGIKSGASADVTISVPTGSPSNVVERITAQVLVKNPGGPVNIRGITIDGTGFPASWFAASIHYESASGTIDHVISQNLFVAEASVAGIVISDKFSVSPSVTITNSLVNIPLNNIYLASGIYANANNGIYQINLNATNNFISTQGDSVGINDWSTGTSAISDNTLSSGAYGIWTKYGTASITGNTITADFGVDDEGSTSTTITGNVLIGWKGIFTVDPNLTIKGNQFLPGSSSVGVPTVGIDLYCSAIPTEIAGNTFLGKTVALTEVPVAGASLQDTAGTYPGVQIIEATCLQ